MLKKILYSLWVVVFILLATYTAKSAQFGGFLDTVENKTFDLRQNMIINSGYKKANKDIVIVAIDDASYEYILDKYGEWPLPRDVYAKVIEYLEAQNPKSIAFDLMFVKSIKSSTNADMALANEFRKFDNIYTAMNMDNQSVELRIPIELPERLRVPVINYSRNIDFDSLSFQNCRAILPEIINATPNIGMINVSRADDGIIRKMPLFIKYQGKFYPQLAFKLGMGIIKENESYEPAKYIIDRKSNLLLNNRKIFMDKDGSAILNWYGPTGTYQQIPMYKLIKAVETGVKDPYDFENKIIYFGTTASSLFDIKTVPVGKIYPGVEIQATYVNNLLDNNFITKANKLITIVLGIILAAITGYLVLNLTSTGIITLSFISMYSAYITFTYLAMKYHNMWFDIVYPVVLGTLVFVSAFVVKYIIKSRDFERQYLLATTDGLTELYNHRYFQEQIKMQVEQSKRYEAPFSLIILDIDHFKKFNDTYGHQAGDAVLKQVATLLKSSVRATDIVCRYGGEEMSIILPNTSKEMAILTAKKICKKVANKMFRLNNTQESNVTISLGVSTFPDDGATASTIIEVADKRLYVSKNNGRNQVN
ncbi:MAG: diguanylate cyclase [Cyanobacteria bacterium SIG32]|nr:diguanylate cyclase [Cyanobacteria bacterium SIG32]